MRKIIPKVIIFFCKVIYLNENVIESQKFNYLIGLFMESIDRKTQLYLREINWENHPLIEDYLEESLNACSPLQKLNAVGCAYKLLVPIIENLRNEKVNVKVDSSFLKQFK